MNPTEPIITDQSTDDPQPQITNPQLNTQNKSLKLIIGLLVIVMLVVLSGMGYMYFQMQSLKKTDNPPYAKLTVNTPQPAQKTQTDESVPSDWKTYENIEYNFEFKYPKEYVYLSETSDRSSVYIATSEGTGEGKGSPAGLNVSKDMWISASVTQTDKAGLSYWNNEIQNKHNIKLSGIDAYKRYVTAKPNAEAAYGYYVDLIKDGKIFRISYLAINEELVNSAESEDIFDQILTTFRFTDENSESLSDNTSDWKSYENEKLGFSVSYPNTIPEISGTWQYEEYKSDVNIDTVGFGPASSKPGGYMWGISKYNNKTANELVDLIGNQFDDREVKQEKIEIDGMAVMLVTVTTASNPTWYSQTVIIEPNSHPFVVYRIGNGAVRSDDFQKFYMSFKLLK